MFSHPLNALVQVGEFVHAIPDFLPKSDPVPFSLTGEKYDQQHFGGRFRKMVALSNPLTLFATKAQVFEAVDLLKKYEESGYSAGVTDADMWAARQLKETAIHPDTGDYIPRPFRIAGYMVYNAPICLGAIMASSTPAILCAHWANQTHNAMVNYSNRNASSPMTETQLLASYTTAVTCAVGMAFGLSSVIKARLPPAKAAQALRFVAFPSSCVASASNCYMMRKHELTTGISVKGPDGTVYGASQAAAGKAMKEMIASRMALSVPVFGLPAIALAIPSVAVLIKKNPKLGMPISFSCLMAGFGLGLPAAIAMSPQTGVISVADMEASFQCLKDAKGYPVKELYYNKGL